MTYCDSFMPEQRRCPGCSVTAVTVLCQVPSLRMPQVQDPRAGLLCCKWSGVRKGLSALPATVSAARRSLQLHSPSVHAVSRLVSISGVHELHATRIAPAAYCSWSKLSVLSSLPPLHAASHSSSWITVDGACVVVQAALQKVLWQRKSQQAAFLPLSRCSRRLPSRSHT